MNNLTSFADFYRCFISLLKSHEIQSFKYCSYFFHNEIIYIFIIKTHNIVHNLNIKNDKKVNVTLKSHSTRDDYSFYIKHLSNPLFIELSLVKCDLILMLLGNLLYTLNIFFNLICQGHYSIGTHLQLLLNTLNLHHYWSNRYFFYKLQAIEKYRKHNENLPQFPILHRWYSHSCICSFIYEYMCLFCSVYMFFPICFFSHCMKSWLSFHVHFNIIFFNIKNIAYTSLWLWSISLGYIPIFLSIWNFHS